VAPLDDGGAMAPQPGRLTEVRVERDEGGQLAVARA
jgi:hypothetical protein